MNYFTQKIRTKLKYEKISKEEDNDHKKQIALEHEILWLKRNNRELIRMKKKLEKSIKRENDSFVKRTIQSQIKKLETKITNNDAFRENALQLRQKQQRTSKLKKNYKNISNILYSSEPCMIIQNNEIITDIL